MKNFVLNYSLKQLSRLCLYPDVKSFRLDFLGMLVCCFYASSWILNVSGVVMNFNGLDSIQQAMVSLPSAHQLLFKSIFMFFTKTKLVKLIENILSLQKFNEMSARLQDEISAVESKFNTYFKIYKGIILMTSYIFIFKPFLSSTRHYPIGWYTPCQIESNFCYATWYVWESIYILIAQYTLASMDSLFFAIIFTLYIEIVKLKEYFETLRVKGVLVDEKTYKEFCNWVDHHNAILDVLKDVNSVFEYQLLNQFVTTVITICFGIYYLNASYPPHLELIPYLLVYHNQLFMYCLAGEMIQRQASSVDIAAYNSQWYMNRDQNFNKCLKFVIQRSQKPIATSIGHIWRLDMGTFIGVLRTSLSIHTFLQTINKYVVGLNFAAPLVAPLVA